MSKELPAEVLRFMLHYCPNTGKFTWKVNSVGSNAGYADKRGYILICIFGIKYRAHRLAYLYMTGTFPDKQIDHINHVKSDNKWSNLRHVSGLDNSKNQKMHSTNTSGFTGVYWLKKKNKWMAQIFTKGKAKRVYYGDNYSDAINARKRAMSVLGYHSNHGVRA